MENRGSHVKEGEKRSQVIKNQQSGLNLSSTHSSSYSFPSIPNRPFPFFQTNCCFPNSATHPKAKSWGSSFYPAFGSSPQTVGHQAFLPLHLCPMHLTSHCLFTIQVPLQLSPVHPPTWQHPTTQGGYVSRIKFTPLPVPIAFVSLLLETVSHIPGSPWTFYVTENDTELFDLPASTSPSVGIHASAHLGFGGIVVNVEGL